jgi:general secretion pathway protein G
MNASTVRSTGFTIIELIAAVTILTVLALMAIPLARLSIKRDKERELRRDLGDMRDAIDRYKDAADRGAFQTMRAVRQNHT